MCFCLEKFILTPYMFNYGLVVAFMIPKTLKSLVLCVIDRGLTGIKHFSYITHKYLEKVYK